jgi:hypothetical protein
MFTDKRILSLHADDDTPSCSTAEAPNHPESTSAPDE